MKKLFIFVICLLVTFSTFGQKIKKAESAYKNGDYVLAIDEYTLLAEQTEDPHLRAQYKFYIADSYRKMNRPDRAERPYIDAIKGGYMSDDIYRLLGEIQLKLGKYDDALSSFESQKRANPSDPLADIGIESCKYAKENEQVNPFFDPKPLSNRVNSGKNEFGVSYYNNGILFSSTRIPSGGDDAEGDEEKDDVYTRAGLGQAKVYMAIDNSGNGNFSRAMEVAELAKMKDFANDGIFTYDPYSRQGLYARTDGKKAYIQFMQHKNNKWVKGEKIEVDSRKEPIGHPCVSPDGNRIYFVSTMPGGYGKSDIWYIERLGREWSKPINAGSKINTAGNEVYPAIIGEYMVFASDGRIGFGGFDLYAAKMENGTPQKPVNLGRPFNTHADDYNLIMRADMKEGVFVSGRNIRRGDDIFQFKGFPFSLMLKGTITDDDTKKAVSNVTVELVQKGHNTVLSKGVTDTDGKYVIFVEPEKQYDVRTSVAGYPPLSKGLVTNSERFGILDDLNFVLSSNASVISGRVYARKTLEVVEEQDVQLLSGGKVLQTVKTNVDGIYKFGDIKGNTQYSIRVITPKGYLSDSKQLSIGAISRNTEFNNANGYDTDFALEPVAINKEVLMEKVNFADGTANLLPESNAELDRLGVLFAQNPQYKLVITAYTDAKAKASTATAMTTQRADAVKAYLVGKGANAGQISTKGMGRAKLLISNARTEEEHKRNNRVTYNITSETKAVEQTPGTATGSTNTSGTTTQQVTQPSTTGTGTTSQPSTTGTGTKSETGTKQPTTPATSGS